MAAVAPCPSRWQLLLCLSAWLLLQQLSAAAEDAPGEIARLQAARTIHVEPAEVRLRGDGRRQQLLVTAEFPDGRLRDVTHLARFESHDWEMATAGDSAIEGRCDGQTLVTVRVGNHTAFRGRVQRRVMRHQMFHQ